MSTYILIPFYNNIIPQSATSYFSLANNTLTISPTDNLGNSTSFISNSYNSIIYIFNGPNMGSFIPSASLSDNTYSIALNSVPPGLSDGTLCVLSKIPSNYSINRTYVSGTEKMINSGNFTIVDSTTMLISINTLNSGSDLLFLYIIITNNEFNILVNEKNTFKVKNVKLQPIRSESPYVTFICTFPILPLIDNETYSMYISTEHSSTISNITFNNTPILPLPNKPIDLVTNKSSKSNTVGSVSLNGNSIPLINTNNSMQITPVLMNQPVLNNSNSVNNTKLLIPTTYSVLLLYQNSNNHIGSGYFSIDSIESNINRDALTFKLPENFTTNSLIDNITNYYTNTVQQIASIFYNKETTTVPKPDMIADLPLIKGTECILNLSVIDTFQKQVNFIKQHSLLFISNGLFSTIAATKTIPISRNDLNDDVISCSVIMKDPLPSLTSGAPYVISTSPILPYVTFKYLSNYNPLNIIDSGLFTILPKSSTITVETIVISNYDISNMSVLSFNTLLYTLVQNGLSTSNSSLPKLNILNSDYSILASLQITHVTPNNNQTTFTYNIISGASSLSMLNSNSNYILTLLSTSDIISIVNNTKYMKPTMIYVNSIISGTKDIIKKIYLNNPNDKLLIIAKKIIEDTSQQAELILYNPYTPINNILNNSLIVNSYNALVYALQSQPSNKELLFIFSRINNLSSPIITLAVLQNLEKYIDSALLFSPKNRELLNIKYVIDTSIIKFNGNLNNSSISSVSSPSSSINSIDMLTNVSALINSAADNLPNNTSIQKARVTINNYKQNNLPDNTTIIVANPNVPTDSTDPNYLLLSNLKSNSKTDSKTNSYYPYIGLGVGVAILILIFLGIRFNPWYNDRLPSELSKFRDTEGNYEDEESEGEEGEGEESEKGEDEESEGEEGEGEESEGEESEKGEDEEGEGEEGEEDEESD